MRLAARWRLALAVAASVVISQTTSLLALAALLWAGMLTLIVLLWGRGDRLRSAFRRLLGVNAFVLAIWVVLPWSLASGSLSLDEHGVALATLISLRINSIALICATLLSGMDGLAIARAAAGLGLPDRLARLLFLMVRYVDVLDETRRRIDRAMRARGFRPGLDWRTFSVIAHQLALILVHAIERAERVEIALRARGWRATPTGDKDVVRD